MPRGKGYPPGLMAGIAGALLAASPTPFVAAGPALAQESGQAEDGSEGNGDVADWILRLFRGSDADGDDASPGGGNDRNKTQSGGASGSGNNGGRGTGGGDDDGDDRGEGGEGGNGGEGGEGGDDD